MFGFTNVTVEELGATIRDLNNKIQDMEWDHERKIRQMIFANDHDKTMEKRQDAKIIAQGEATIAELQNKVARLETELEARLALQEDIHMDELIAFEKKYNDQLELARAVVEAKAREEAIEIIDDARSTAKSIITDAHDDARRYAREFITTLTKQLADSKIPFGDIESIIKSATENYPSLSDVSVSSTSSSK